MTMMKTYEINSLTNEKIKSWTKLHQSKYRRETGLFLAEGEHLIQEALKAGLVETLIVLKDSQIEFDVDVRVEVTPEVLHKLCQTESNSECIAVCRMWDQPESLGDRVLLLDQIQDPGNVGTIIRTAHSFGFDSVVLSENSVDLTNEKVLRASQGAIFHLPVLQREMKPAIEECRKNGLMILGTGLKHSVPLSTIPDRDKVAIILGNEGQGVRSEILHLCDAVVKIEINCFESLNVAVACGILCYRFRKP